jgi:hypothetical protein
MEVSMTRILLSMAFVGMILAGCQSTPADKMAFKALNVSWIDIGPEYSAYVSEDPKLTLDQKAQRTRLVVDISRLLAERSK